MGSIAFPAFERAQQEHMGFDRAAEELYQSAAQAVRSPSRASASHPIDANAAEAATPTQPEPNKDAAEATQTAQPKITKRVNARLQLAAALIEADNERILEKAQFWHIYHPSRADDALRPPPPPEPSLASQSAIFAPYREGASLAVKRHVRTWSAATGLSRLLEPSDDGRRPSVDFLGVALPTERRARSCAGSNVSALAGTERPHSRNDSIFSNAAASVLGRTSKAGSRPTSVFAAAGDDDALSDADVLSEWGVDKFLSKEERDRAAAGQRSRAQSLAGDIATRPSFDDSAPQPIATRKSLDAIRFPPNPPAEATRASSDIGTGTASHSKQPGSADAKLELLAKIKLYRERQENLPPSEWNGPGPTATKDQVVEHIIASSDTNKRASLREASLVLSDDQPRPDTDAADSATQQSADFGRRSSMSVIDRPRPLSRADSTASSAFLGATEPIAQVEGIHDDSVLGSIHPRSTGEAGEQPASHSQANVEHVGPLSSQAIPIPQTTQALPSQPTGPEGVAADADMVGIGSYSRSHSRRNSFLGGPFFSAEAQGASAPANPDQPESSSLLPRNGSTPIISSPLSHARVPSRSWSQDLFAEHDLGLGPSPFAAALQAASPSFGPVSDANMLDVGAGSGAPPAIDFNSLTTRQLQAVARNSTFPSHLGINRDLLAEELAQDEQLDQDEFGQLPKPRARPISYDFTALAQDLGKTGGENFEIQLGGTEAPDLSSANWGKPRKKWFRLSMMMDAKGKPMKQKSAARRDGDEGDAESDAEDLSRAVDPVEQIEAAGNLSDLYAAEPAAKMAVDLAIDQEDNANDVDDDYISPPRRGPLRPRGLAACMPKTILMPQPLQGTEFAPKLRLTDPLAVSIQPLSAEKRHSIHVPDGFVLHDSRGGLPPMRSLVVQSANGPQPMFAAKISAKKQEQIAVRLKAVEVGRTVQVPAAAPRGIGRRAAAPTTALFRNHLVQHDDEREGWGWEAGTRVDDIFQPDKAEDSDDDDKPLADIKKQSRSAKRAAKRLVKAKRKRKAARRVRRAKREQALAEGKSFQELGVGELSPDEDLDLSSTTSEEDETETDTESDLWASDDDKRWVDDSKPAGKLYGKSLLDIATERNTERKSKARFYGQVQLEDGETAMLQVDGEDRTGSLQPNGTTAGAKSVLDDGASIAPSMARSFRDKPIGYNDTRERMEAVFGADQVWAREMAKRQEEEAHEAEMARARAEAEAAAQQQVEAQAKAKKERSLFTLTKKSKKKSRSMLDVSNLSAMGSSVSLTASNAEAASITPSKQDAKSEERGESAEIPERSPTPVEPPVLALDIGGADGAQEEGRRTPALLAGEEKATQEWLIASDAEPEDSDDDDVPLSQVKKNVASRPVSFAAGLSLQPSGSGHADSSDEELPLAALKEKRIRQSMLLGGGKLDLDFSSTPNSPSRLGNAAAQTSSASSLRTGSGLAAASPKGQANGAEEDSDEDLPLGQRHPGGNAVLAAMRLALENEKREKKEARQAEKAQRRAAKLARQVNTDDVDGPGGDDEAKTNGKADDEEEDASDDDDSEDDKPLGYVHPQAAIIAEQAALIRQLQMEKGQQQRTGEPSPSGSGFASPSGMDVRSSMMLNRMSAMPSMGMMGGMGMPDARHSIVGLPSSGPGMMSMPQWDGMPAASSGLPMGMSMSTSMAMGMPLGMGAAAAMSPGSQIGGAGGMAPPGMPMSMPMPMMGSPPIAAPMTPNPMAMMMDPKASSIHNWRTQVPADATATVTPPGNVSAVNSSG